MCVRMLESQNARKIRERERKEVKGKCETERESVFEREI